MWNIFDVTIILASVLIFIVNQVIQKVCGSALPAARSCPA